MLHTAIISIDITLVSWLGGCYVGSTRELCPYSWADMICFWQNDYRWCGNILSSGHLIIPKIGQLELQLFLQWEPIG